MKPHSKRASAHKGTVRRKADDSLFESMSPVHPDAAGIDIGSERHYVSVPPDRDPQPVRSFGCCTSDLHAMADWLLACRICTVVMESTGVYWVPAYRLLADRGLDVRLVDAQHAKGVPGRKTDVWDCQWLRKLHTYGLLNGCFVPGNAVDAVRTYWRMRSKLIEQAAETIQHMHKALEQMNVQLHKALSDVCGVTGLEIMRAIVAGERNPEVLALHRRAGVKCTQEELVKALEGDWRPEHLFALQQALQTFDFVHEQVRACDAQLQECMRQFEDGQPAAPGSERPRRSTYRRKNQPHFDLAGELERILGVDLCAIEGIDATTAQTVFSEIGGDVSAFPTEKHWCSWLCLCPNNRKTGGRVRSRRTRKSFNRITQALRVAAQSLHKSKSWLGAYYRRILARKGPSKAITCTAHKLAVLIYRLLKHGEAYVRRSVEDYQRQYEEQARKALVRRAKELGVGLMDLQTGEVLAATAS